MESTKVAITRAIEYKIEQVYQAVQKAVNLLGGLDGIIKPDSNVFVKINHLPPASPSERGIVTNPVFVEAVVTLLKEFGSTITVGDDVESSEAFQVSGIAQMCQRAGVRLVNLREGGFMEKPCNGKVLDKIYLSKIVLDADVIVNLPKMKTHSLTVYTGGIKNMYGTIPNGRRRYLHGEYMRNDLFSQVLTDIFSQVKPHLTIMDGIVAMEGEGPAGGKLRNAGVVLASRDTVALDAVATAIMGFNPLDILTTQYASERGLGTGNLEAIEVLGESIEEVKIPHFRPPMSAIHMLATRVPRGLTRFGVNQMTPRPYIVDRKCVGCLECQKICPVSAISEYGKIVRIDRKLCIRCMCCHEVCRFSAITPRRPFAGNIISVINKLRHR